MHSGIKRRRETDVCSEGGEAIIMIVTERMDDRGKEKENWHSDRKEKEKLLLLPFPTFFIVLLTHVTRQCLEMITVMVSLSSYR